MATENNTEQNFLDDNEVIFCERKRWVFLGLPWTFTKYTITPSLLTTDKGLFNTTEDDCYMYKIQDVQLTSSFFEKVFGLGTIICFTGDITDQTLKLEHIRHSKDVKTYLIKQSEAARLKRRTIHTQDIGAHHGIDIDGDGIID